jgi:CDP-diacylglycerol--glycerol-3-phosphate 3-phosphatidyltransferase
MTNLIRKIPNILTLLRIILTIYFNFYIINNFGSILIPIVCCSIILLTDFFDGKIARTCGSASNTGAVLDVTADLLYIILSYIVIYNFHIVPLWFLFIIIFNFTEFIVTSYFINRNSNKEIIIVFDYLGRLAAVIFYIVPIVAYLSFQLLQEEYMIITNFLMYTAVLFVSISFLYRLWRCIGEIKSLKTIN